MTFKNDQKEIALPTVNNQLRSSVSFLPRFFRTEANKKFLQSTIDQLIQPGVAEKINGYVGKKTAKSFSPTDNYLDEVSLQRQNYQLEPALVIKDNLDNITFYKDYNDYINQLQAFGANVSNHDTLNSQDMYTWNPHIDWDKFVNFREYYWLPYGPTPVPVRAKSKQVVKTYQVSLGETDGYSHYIFTPDGKTPNPTIKLYRGERYKFEINTPGHPIAFAIARTFTPGTALLVAGTEGIRGQGLYDAELFGNSYDLGEWIIEPSSGSVTIADDNNQSTIYPDGITKFDTNGKELSVVYIDQGTIEFNIPENAPDHLYYISKYDVNTSGLFNVFNIEENTERLNVYEEIIGMKSYRSGNGVDFTNGLKIYFQGNVEPETFKNGYWYVEGVGSEIKLISESGLLIPSTYNADTQVPFDGQPFDSNPFSDSVGYPTTKEYILINRASNDGNPWARSNKWFHKEVIEYSAKINNISSTLDQELRAKRPIIEFEAGIQLFNYGTEAKADVDLVDSYTKDIFSTIEGSIGYNVDGIDLVDGMRVLFTADTDNLVKGKIFKVKFIEISGKQQITLVEELDSSPLELQNVFVKTGVVYGGKSLHFKNNVWSLSQQKTKPNQEPLFMLCCPQGYEYSNQEVFNSSSFKGSKIFSYKVGEGTNDAELGFPLTYKSIENFGDIVFECNLLSDVLTYQDNDNLVKLSTSIANLRKYTSRTEFSWVNAWSSEPVKSKQKVLRQYVATLNQNVDFEIDMYNNASLIEDLQVQVFVNQKFKKENIDYSITRNNTKLYVSFNNSLNENDVVLIKTYSLNEKNNNGWYEIPLNLERNPLNEDAIYFTLGEVTNHVDSMIEDLRQFNGEFPGASNLRDLSNISLYGKRFVKHTGLLNLANYHITNKDFNIIKSIKNSKKEYARFKRIFAETAETLGFDGETKIHVDKVLYEINKDKIKSQPFYFSDMLAYGNAEIRKYRVLDSDAQYYPLINAFNLSALSDRSVLIYLNGLQLTYKKHYEFTDEGFVYVFSNHKEDDIIEIHEYVSTNGSFIPPTPTKLGLYPKFEPEIIIDDTYLSEEPSKTDPYKIYGQLDETISEITGWFYPVYESKTSAIKHDKLAGGSGQSVSLKLIGLNKILHMPKSLANLGQQDTSEYEEYPYGVAFIKGHDGSVIKAFKDYRDNLFIDLEKRIFNNIKIDYDESLLRIHDVIGGYSRNTNVSKQSVDNILLNDFVDWTKTIDVDYTINNFYKRDNSFTYNYSNMEAPNAQPLPGFWRGVYMHLYDTDRPHSAPWEMLGFSIKPKWWNSVYGPAPYTSNNTVLWKDIEDGIIREPNKQIRVNQKFVRTGFTDNIPVDEKGRLKSPLESGFAKNFFFRYVTQNFKFGDHAPVEAAWRKSSEYPFALLIACVLSNPARVIGLGYDLSRIKKNLAGQVIYEPTGKIIQLDQIEFPNTYAETNKVLTSGLVNYIHNYVASNILEVYDEYKTQVKTMKTQLGFKLAGFSEKEKIKLILDSRSPRQSAEGGVFVPFENYSVILNTSSPVDIAVYSGVVVEKVSNGYIIRGYSQEKPYFEYYSVITSENDRTITVGGISEVTTPWVPNKAFIKDQVIEYNYEFYRATDNFVSGLVFSSTNLVKLQELPIVGGKRAVLRKNFSKSKTLKLNYGSRLANTQEVVDFLLGYGEFLKDIGFKFENFNSNINEIEDWKLSSKEFLFWTTQGWAEGTTIVLSPAANKIEFSRQYAVVDDLYDKFYDYSILKSDGTSLDPSFNSIARNINDFGIIPKNVDDGIYHIRLPLVQKEHVVVIDNKTVFEDVIYEPTTGYRQDRIEVSGYRSDNWQGSLNIPGFVFDTAEVSEWKQWKDYSIGNLVKHKQYYYIAKENISGSELFNDTLWIRLNQKPESKLITNFEYRINQFNDFYDTESEYFDEEQQRLAQHLIGYQKREYLQNLIKDDNSQYKFYQGFIREKGTKNSVIKLFNSLSDSENQVEFYEDWAVQIGQYGSTDAYSQVEIEINEKQIKESPQIFEIADRKILDTDNVYRILPSELYSKPVDFNKDFLLRSTNKDEFVLTGGYVNEDDVSYIAKTVDDILNADCNQVSVNDYIWLVNDDSNGWNVLQHVDTSLILNKVVDVTSTAYDGKSQKEFYTTGWVGEEVVQGEYIAVRSAQQYNLYGFYRVDKVFSNKLLVSVPTDNNIKVFEEVSLPMSKLRSIRIKDPNKFKGSLENLYPKLPVYTRQLVKFVLIENNTLIVDTRDTSYNVFTTANNLIVQLRNTTDAYVKLSVDKLDLDSINNLNNLVQTKKFKNQKVWIDNFENENWAVLRNEETFAQQQILQDPVTDISVANKFGNSVSVTADNNILVVGDPKVNNGVVYQYKRNRDVTNFVLSQTISPPKNDYFSNENSNFGNSVSISEDGKFMAVGIPNASNVKSRYKGTFTSSATYKKYDIVNYREKLWRAQKNIVPTTADVEFTPFTTYNNLLSQYGTIDSMNLLVTGNPRINDSVVSHMLVRAPYDAFYASKETDTLILKWNKNSFVNLTNPYQPFAGLYPQITDQVISSSHTIVKKVEKILYLEYPELYPSEGDIVRTSTGSGKIVYVGTKGSQVILYIDSITGILSNNESLSGVLLNQAGETIGSYAEELSDASYQVFGGYWMIETPFEYSTKTLYKEEGKGLVYVDLIPAGTTTYLENLYANIRETTNTQASFMSVLSYTGDPGEVAQTINSKLWVVRAPVGFSTSRNFKIDLYKRNNINPNNYGLLDVLFNKTLVKKDTWDGFIDYEIPTNSSEFFNSRGVPYEATVGDIIQDVQVTANGQQRSTFKAQVMFYKKVFNKIRVYVKITEGSWSFVPGSIEVKIRRIRPGQTSRMVGIVNNVNDSMNLASNEIGKLLVFEHSTFLPEPSGNQYDLVGEEYYFYTSGVRAGIDVVSLPPSENNLNYSRVYNISADSSGNASSKENEGAVAIYQRISNGLFKLDRILVSEYNRQEFGKQVKISKQNNQYTLFVSTGGTLGQIEIYVHGPGSDEKYKGIWNPNNNYLKNDIVYFEGNFYKAIKNATSQDNNAITYADLWKNISWKVAKDDKFEGTFNRSYGYSVDSVVIKDGVYYRAKTNILGNQNFNANRWEEESQELEFAGYIPGPTQVQNYDMFGDKFDVNASGDLLIATNVDSVRKIKNVAVYRRFKNFFVSQLISSLYDDNSFGQALSINREGSVFAVSEPENDEIKTNQGKVYVYVYDGNRFIYNQTLVPPSNEVTEKFGYSVAVGNDHIAITSLNGDMKVPSTFDKYTEKNANSTSAYENSSTSALADNETTFDKGFTQFKNTKVDSGSVYIFESIRNSLVFAENIYNNFTSPAYNGSSYLMFGESLVVNDNHVYAITINETSGNKRGKILDYRRDKSKKSWTIEQTQIVPVDTNKIHEIFLYNKQNNKIITYLDFIDPVQGKIAGPAEQEITYKVKFDPAVYTYNEYKVATGSTSTWGKEHVGEVWWKTDSAKFANAYQGTRQYQKTEWNKILSGSVEVYEWVESKYPPVEWDKLADTETGIAIGISGTSVYGNTNYSERFEYDSVSQTFTSLYYFWVKNKKVVPNLRKRRVSIYDVKNLIENPRLQGYRFVNFIDANSFVLNNCDSLIKDTDTVLCIRYNTTNKEIQNIHTEYQIISDGLSTSVPHPDIELKWFNSLIGFDNNKRPVPDINLSVKDRYGIQSEPRQSMFVNRSEALKQFIERANSVLIDNPIADNNDISSLFINEEPPTERSRRFDVKVDQIEELKFIRTNRLVPAVLTPVIVNGKITKVNITNPGFGYKIPPTCEVYGSGQEAEVEVEINNKGQVVSTKIISPGYGYNTNTAIQVRKFTVLVSSDSTNFGKWSIYSWESMQNSWARTAVQEYDVRKFWNYVDWYASGYNKFTSISRTVDGTYQLNENVDKLGDIIRVNNVGTGGWMLLEKVANNQSDDYTTNYKTIGRQNGTIQFLDSLYDYSKNTIGFDNRSFDSFVFDNVPIVELRTILETIRDNLFIGDLKVEYNQLFMSSLRYVLSEQMYVDWLFKTSFININHSAGELIQDITFNADNLDDYQSYVEEVKPYSTTIREFVSRYNTTENTNSLTTDFDLPPYYSKINQKIEVANVISNNDKIYNLSDEMDQNVKEIWIKNQGFSVKDILISFAGEGYSNPPLIDIVGGGGTGAKAVAFVANGKITKVEVIEAGSGYVSTPNVILSSATSNVPARLSVVLGDSLIRTSKLNIKYDRVSKKETQTTLQRVETFVGTGSQLIYNLNWPLDLKRKNTKIFVNNSQLLKSEFSYNNIIDKTGTYTKNIGQVKFTNPPAVGATIRIEYTVSAECLNAIDRIHFFYKPTANMPGISVYSDGSNDYSQIVSGIDYGGVEITGVNFNEKTGWNSNTWAGEWNVNNSSPNANSNLDMIVTGGNLKYQTASGIKAEDIIVDGDSFVSALTGSGPEELMQGQTFDSVNITVFTKLKDTDESPAFSFSIFKDMLNRTHYKKTDSLTVLTKDLNVNDLVIEVNDASILPVPKKTKNLPGIIFINGERIEYFAKDGNVLKQLRRGTLGTGVKQTHSAGSVVINQGSATNVPYKDKIETQVEVGDGTTTTYNLTFDKTTLVGDQKVYTQHEFEVFVGGVRLKKEPTTVFDIDLLKMDSPDGDTQIPAEYVINNSNGTITFVTAPPATHQITIIRKTGRVWNSIGESLQNSNTDIAIFLKSNLS